MKIFLLLAILFSAQAYSAESTGLRKCSQKEIKNMTTESEDWFHNGDDSEEYNAHFLLNSKKEIVGMYTFKDGDIYAEVCEPIQTDMTVSNSWFYWQNDDLKTAPSTWKAGNIIEICQDEGKANFKVMKSSGSGEVTVKMSIIGWDEDEHVLKTDLLTFSKKL